MTILCGNSSNGKGHGRLRCTRRVGHLGVHMGGAMDPYSMLNWGISGNAIYSSIKTIMKEGYLRPRAYGEFWV